MTGHSLRIRLVLGGLIAILIALGIAGGSLVLLFERHVSRTLASDLDIHLKQLLAGIEIDPTGSVVLTQSPSDPRFSEPLSGLYWQLRDDRGQFLRSRSLWDASLDLPPDNPGPSEVHQHEVAGPSNTRLLVAERAVTLAVGDGRVAVRVAVAANLARVSEAARAFAKDLALALGLLALVLATATSIQVALGLRPLDTLRRGITEIRAGRSRHLPESVPAEVRPLVEEVNALMDAQAQEIERSRSRAADLAHGLKTPLAALATDAARLHERGEHEVAKDIQMISDTMGRHVDRELARARLRARLGRRSDISTSLAPLIGSLIATLARTPAGMRVAFDCQIEKELQVPFDRTDLAEVLGNLLENAARHATKRVRITAEPSGTATSIVIEDDGEGIPPSQMNRVLERGTRLDERSEGAGLGLSIVQDVLDAYGWELRLSSSKLGGLKAAIIPTVVQAEAHTIN